MKEQEATWGVVLKFWWAWTWRSVLVAAVAGFILSFVVTLIAKAAGADMRFIMLLLNILSALVALPISFYILKKIFSKDFGSFRIAIITDEDNNFNTQKH